METETEIPILVGGIEKWITGLTKRTTCDDVIYAILQFENTSKASRFTKTVTDYAIYECRPHTERRIRGRTLVWRILRGAERENVKFVFRKLESSVEMHQVYKSKKYSKYYNKSPRGRQESDFMCTSSDDSDLETDADYQRYSTGRESQYQHQLMSQDIEYKPVQLQDKKADEQLRSSDKELPKLLLTLVEQERTLRSQSARISELDVQIESHETKLHKARIKENGTNYVQETYMKNQCKCGNEELFKRINSDILPNVKPDDVAEYMFVCENIIKVEEKLKEASIEVHDLTLQLFEESRNTSNVTYNMSTPTKEPTGKEITRLKHHLKLCLDVSTCQENDMQLNNQSMQLLEDELSTKYDIIHGISSELGIIPRYNHSTTTQKKQELPSLDYPQDGRPVSNMYLTQEIQLKESSQSNSFEIPSNGMFSTLLNNSDDSDTGVSSLHSASEDSNPILETLV